MSISYHSLCRWTFNPGKGGFVPGNIRPAWHPSRFTTIDFVQLVAEEIQPRLPDHVRLGVELHYDMEVDEDNALEVAQALNDTGLHLAMLTPGAHHHFAYGGIASPDEVERQKALAFGERCVDLGYGPLKPAWHTDSSMAPTLVVWNGSFGYDLASVGIRTMYDHLKAGLAALCDAEARQGGALFIGLEPKPNEGHPAMLLPTVASAALIWHKLEDEYGVDLARKGVNKEIGHSEMIGLDHVHDTVEELDHGMMVHTHLNSQGYNDGIILGGPARYDIDHGTRVNGMNIAIAGLMQEAAYSRWKGHDMQPRPYDNEAQAIDRVVRSIISWEACEAAADELDTDELLACLSARDTAAAEDLMRAATVEAQQHFNALYAEA